METDWIDVFIDKAVCLRCGATRNVFDEHQPITAFAVRFGRFTDEHRACPMPEGGLLDPEAIGAG